MGSVDGKTQWQERHMVNPSIEQYLKTLGYIKIYNGPYLHPDALKEYDYFYLKNLRKNFLPSLLLFYMVR